MVPCPSPTCSPCPTACNSRDWHVPAKETVSQEDATVPGELQKLTYQKWLTGEDSNSVRRRKALGTTPHRDRSGLFRRQWPLSQYSQGNRTSPFKIPSILPRSVAIPWVFHSSGVSVIRPHQSATASPAWFYLGFTPALQSRPEWSV